MIQTDRTGRPTPVDAGPDIDDAKVSVATSRRGKVMIVDDDPLMRETTERVLARAHYDVVQAGSVAEARVLWEQHLSLIHI